MSSQIITPIITPINAQERAKIDFRAGDTVKVWQKIKEKDKFRLQAFEGLVLARKHGNESGATFTVRRVIDGVGVEKIFPLYSPMIDSIEILRRARVRRAKLYFIREKAAKEIRRQMRKILNTKEEKEIIDSNISNEAVMAEKNTSEKLEKSEKTEKIEKEEKGKKEKAS